MAILVDDIIIKDAIIYDLADGDADISLGNFINKVVSVQLNIVSASVTGITFTVLQGNDGTNWAPIRFNGKNLELDNDTADDILTLNTDLFISKALGLRITGTGGAATGTVYILINGK